MPHGAAAHCKTIRKIAGAASRLLILATMASSICTQVLHAQNSLSRPAPQVINPLVSVPECVPGRLSDYEKLGTTGCRIGDIQFSSFLRATASNGLSSRAISVTPGTAIDSSDPALVFEGPWVGKPQTATVAFSYKVSAPPPAKPVIAASLQMQFGQITGTGEASIATKIGITGRSGDPSAIQLQLKLGGEAPKKDSTEADLPAPAAELRIIETVTLSSGKDGSARINGFMTVFQLEGVKSVRP